MKVVIKILSVYLFIVAITATINRYKMESKSRFYILFYFWFSASKELFAQWYSQAVDIHNAFLFNVYQIIEVTVLFLAFHAVLKKTGNKKIAVFIYAIYFICYFYTFFTKDINYFFDYNYSIGSISIVLIILLYFYEILNDNQILALNKNFMFWFGTGLLVYHLPSIPFTLLIKYYMEDKITPSVFIVNFVLIFLSNTTFLYGLLCAKPNQK